MELMGITGVAAITVIAYLLGEVAKASRLDNKWIPIICGVAGGLLGLQRGDVLLNIRHHTAIYCGNGMEVEASINENGGVTGGQPGDQTGREFLVRPYRNYPWDCVLRYTGADAGAVPEKIKPTYYYLSLIHI